MWPSLAPGPRRSSASRTWAAHYLCVFQRTPSSVDVRGNKPTDPEWVRTLTPGWQKRRMENFNTMFTGVPQDEDLVSDGWTDIFRDLGPGAAARAVQGGVVGRMIEISDFKKMNQGFGAVGEQHDFLEHFTRIECVQLRHEPLVIFERRHRIEPRAGLEFLDAAVSGGITARHHSADADLAKGGRQCRRP